ncbi:MAG: nucleotidyl transferase AbiEii/AbiGii toxin family protein [Candidatus Thermoplasmatota archaeon]
MLTRTQLKEFHEENVPLHLIELDYIQSIILKHIYLKHDSLVFKGGTSLRKVHGLDRFSEDLDFNIIGKNAEEILMSGIKGLEKTGIEAELAHFDDRKDVYLAKIRYKGPLHQGTELSEGTLKIDISKHKIHNKTSWETILGTYPDTGTYSVKVMDLEEILAEKFRSLVQRDTPRDLYDIWYVLKKGAELRYELLDQKFRDLDMTTRTPTDILSNYRLSEEDWKRDMRDLIHRTPEKEKIWEEISEIVNQSLSDLG